MTNKYLTTPTDLCDNAEFPNPRTLAEYREAEYQDILRHAQIYMDTDIFLYGPHAAFFNRAKRYLRQYHKRIMVPIAVRHELMRARDKAKNFCSKLRIARALHALDRYERKGLVTYCGGDDCTADAALLRIFAAQAGKRRLALLTRDFYLAKEILHLTGGQQNADSPPIHLRSICQAGYLSHILKVQTDADNGRGSYPLPAEETTVFRFGAYDTALTLYLPPAANTYGDRKSRRAATPHSQSGCLAAQPDTHL